MATANLLQTSVSGGTQNALALQGDGVFFPKASTASRLALTLTTTDKGFVVYDTTDSNIYFWNGTAWESIPGSGDAGANGSVQYNDNGIVSGATNFSYDKVTSAVAITGDLTVDTSTLKVNSSANRVGVLTASPESELDVRGLIAVRGTPTFPTTGVGAELFYSSSNSNSNLYSYNRATSAWVEMAYGASSHKFEISGGTAMTLDSNGLGVGTAVYGAGTRFQARTAANINFAIQSGTVNVTGVKVNAFNNAGSANIPLELNGSILSLNTGEVERVKIDSSGNVGVGVTPLERLTVAGTGSFGGSGNTGIKFHSASPLSNNLCWLLANDQGNSNILNLYYYSAGVFSGRALVVNQFGNFMIRTPATPPTIPDNEMMVFNLTSNTNLRISVKGTDGTTRVANITLA